MKAHQHQIELETRSEEHTPITQTESVMHTNDLESSLNVTSSSVVNSAIHTNDCETSPLHVTQSNVK